MDAITLAARGRRAWRVDRYPSHRALLSKRGNRAKRFSSPIRRTAQSRHGRHRGYTVENIRSNEQGEIDLEAWRAPSIKMSRLDGDHPNTIGVFEQDIIKAAEILHAKGAMLYMDGANMNALVGIAALAIRRGCNAHQPAQDVLHASTAAAAPAEGGSCEEIARAVPADSPSPARRQEVGLRLQAPEIDRRVRAFYGNFGVLVRALAYICALAARPAERHRGCGAERQLHPQGPRALFRPALQGRQQHEVVFSDDRQAKQGVHTGDIAKRLIDYGFHPYTVSLPAHRARRSHDRATETESSRSSIISSTP